MPISERSPILLIHVESTLIMVVAAVLNGKVTAFGSGKKDSQSNASPPNGSDASFHSPTTYVRVLQIQL